MVANERDMIRPLVSDVEGKVAEERSTSLQPTYEDSVPPEQDESWDDER